jgi:hypothetical protein
VDLYYNICLVTVHCTSNLPKKSFNDDTGFFDLYGNHSKDVVALGRSCEPWSLKVASGKLIPRRHRFDCEELLVSSCKITKVSNMYILILHMFDPLILLFSFKNCLMVICCFQPLV